MKIQAVTRKEMVKKKGIEDIKTSNGHQKGIINLLQCCFFLLNS